MIEWKIKKINNKKSKYDFRLLSNNNDYSNVNFTKYNVFRILVSLSSYLTNGVIFKDNFYIIKSNKNVPTIFDFYIDKYSKVSKFYLTLNKNMTKIILNKNKETFYIETLSKPNTKVFSSLFLFDEIKSVSSFIKNNKKSYIDIVPKYNNKYIITGWVNNNNIILNLLKYNKTYKSSTLTRCKIHDKMIINQIKLKKIKSYCIFLVSFIDKYNFKIENTIPITFDEYLSYIYDLMLPYKYDLNDMIRSKEKIVDYKNHPENLAFAIDPDGSKDRDDAIAWVSSSAADPAIVRGEAPSYTIVNINAYYLNANSMEHTAYDVYANYSLNTENLGSFRFDVNATQIDEYSFDFGGGNTGDAVGLQNLGIDVIPPLPETTSMIS